MAIAPADPRQGTSVQISEFTLGSTPVPAGPSTLRGSSYGWLKAFAKESRAAPTLIWPSNAANLPEAIQKASDAGLRQVL